MAESRKYIQEETFDEDDGFNESAYVRIKAGDILIKCLEDRSGWPMQQLVEALILSGPENIDILREILTETNHRKVQVGDDINQVLTGLRTNLEGYNITLRGLKKASTLAQMKPGRFMTMIKGYGITDEDIQESCLRLFKDAQDLEITLLENYSLFDQIEEYLEDWIMGFSFQITHYNQHTQVQ